MILPQLPPGHRNGRLVVLTFERDPKRPKHPVYRCRCDCGTIVAVQRGNLSRTHSCGCIKVEMLQAKATHGLSHTPEFRIWIGMIERCSRPSNTAFPEYGARGITVCQRWLDSFATFYADMGPRPTAKHSIDRIANNQGYTPENCRWATATTQRENQSRVVLHTINGITGTRSMLARHFRLHLSTVKYRLRHGWTLERALTTPVK